MDQTLQMRLGCYCWLIEGQIAYRWASTKERAKDQLFEDGICEYESTLASECQYVGKFGTVDAAIRAATDLLEMGHISPFALSLRLVSPGT